MLLMLSGAIGAGKDTFGEMLYDAFDKFGYKVDIVKFADPIRKVAIAIGCNPDNRDTKEVPFARSYTSSELSETVFETFTSIPPYERRMLAVRLHQKLLAIRSEKRGGIRIPVVSCRQFMQTLGNLVREYDADYYIKHLILNVPEGRVNICTDARFMNEQAVGDYTVYIDRPENPLAVSTLDQSEAAQNLLKANCKSLVINDGTIEMLDAYANNLAKMLINKGYCDGAEKSSGTGSLMC